MIMTAKWYLGTLWAWSFLTFVLQVRKNPEKTSPRKLVPAGDRTKALCVTGAHATACSTTVDILSVDFVINKLWPKWFIIKYIFKIIVNVLKLIQKKKLNVLLQNLTLIRHFEIFILILDRLFGIVVSTTDYHPSDPGFNSRLYHRKCFGSIGSGIESTQPREDNWVATWYEKWRNPVKKTEIKVER